MSTAIVGSVIASAAFIGLALAVLWWDERRYHPDPFASDDTEHAERLRAELHAAADELEPDPGGLEAIRGRLGHETHAWPVMDRFDALFPGWRP
jgi:hypothetical protein